MRNRIYRRTAYVTICNSIMKMFLKNPFTALQIEFKIRSDLSTFHRGVIYYLFVWCIMHSVYILEVTKAFSYVGKKTHFLIINWKISKTSLEIHVIPVHGSAVWRVFSEVQQIFRAVGRSVNLGGKYRGLWTGFSSILAKIGLEFIQIGTNKKATKKYGSLNT